MDSTTKKVTLLEDTLNRFILNTDKTLYQLSKEMSEFKEESRLSRKHMETTVTQLSKEMSEFKGEMRDFKDEMKDFKDEMKDFKEESQKDRKAMNKKWGELSNKLGSFAEDIAAPNIPRIARDYFNEPTTRFSTNLRASPPNNLEVVYEFDAVAVSKQKVFLLESKYTVRGKYIEKLPALIQNFKTCYPEYADKELIVLFASMKLHDNTIKRLSKMGIYAMAMGDETMDVVNFEEVKRI